MKKLLLLPLLLLSLSACNMGADSPRGFSLPEGNAETGRQVFIAQQCVDCHSVDGIDLPGAEREGKDLNIVLGGNSPRVRTYAELVTSIINPSHRVSNFHVKVGVDEDGNSLMRNYNDVLTVTELIDLVAFLQPQFKVAPYYYTRYPTIH